MRRIALVVILAVMTTRVFAADRAVVVTATAGFRHDSIEAAEMVIANIAARTGWYEPVFARTEDEMAEALAPQALQSVKAVMFVLTTGELQIPSRQALFQWVQDGGVFIGVHSAADTWHDSPEYIKMLGGEFMTHPDQTTAEIFVEDPSHPAVRGLESPHTMFEEIYLFKNFAPEAVTILLSLRQDPSEPSIRGFFPLAWCRSYGNGLVFYTALGHRTDVWASPWYQQHLTSAIAWALNREPPPRRRSVRRH